MRKNLDAQPALFPMPVLIVAAYDAEGIVQAMNAAWGTICGAGDKVALCINESHATSKAIDAAGAFTVAIADRAHMVEADYLGIATGNKIPDKFEKSGLHATRSERVNAPVVDEFPIALECELAETVSTENLHAVIGNIVGVNADERVLDEEGKIDPVKLDAIMFEMFGRGYYTIGEKAGQAWGAGVEMAKAAMAGE